MSVGARVLRTRVTSARNSSSRDESSTSGPRGGDREPGTPAGQSRDHRHQAWQAHRSLVSHCRVWAEMSTRVRSPGADLTREVARVVGSPGPGGGAGRCSRPWLASGWDADSSLAVRCLAWGGHPALGRRGTPAMGNWELGHRIRATTRPRPAALIGQPIRSGLRRLETMYGSADPARRRLSAFDSAPCGIRLR